MQFGRVNLCPHSIGQAAEVMHFFENQHLLFDANGHSGPALVELCEPRTVEIPTVNEIRLGNPEKALALLENYNAAVGKQAWGSEHVGRAYDDMGDLEAAEKAYREAIALNPHAELGHLWLGQLLVKTGRREEAKPLFERFRRLRSLQTQERELEQSVARRPKNVRRHVMLLVNLARVRHLLGREKDALRPPERALELTPDDARLQQLYEGQLERANAER